MNKAVTIIIPILVSLAVAVSLGVLFYNWVSHKTDMSLSCRLPGGDGTPEKNADSQGNGVTAGKLTTFDGKASELKGSWPCFRGANHDGIRTGEGVKLLCNWDNGGPQTLWSVELGEGYAAAAVHNGRVYVIDYDMQEKADAVRCLSLDDGREIWRYSYPVKIKRNHGMSRTIPAVTDKYVVAIGPMCHVTCLDAVTGKLLWSMDMVKRFNTEVPLWYTGQCPLLDNDRAIIAPGGSSLMTAVDCRTGQIVWQSANPDNWQMTHSSITPMTFAGRRFYIYCASGGVAGISAEDGAILWKTDQWKLRTNIPSPVVVGDGLIFLSAGYNKGSMFLKLIQTEDGIKAQPLRYLEAEVFGSEQQTPIFYKGFIYGVRADGQLVCMSAGGDIVWTSGDTNKFGRGPYIIADGLLYLLDDNGILTMAQAAETGFLQLGQTRILDGHDCWGPPAIAAGRLLARDFTGMVCLALTGR